ncbi:MAG: NifB/NifX family molybdenum-iron cluster-binding protein [Ruminiclostridium sp.]|nr:NifB/NifX family molybdenum-iron cluster-binding protein [Ruminiclostridium sp.]
MKIAVTYDNGMVFQHFGHTEQFKIYETENSKIISSEVVDTNGSGHGALAGFLSSLGVKVLICGGIGGGAQTALKGAGIEVYGGVTGLCDLAVQDYLNGTLLFNPDVKCSHHGEGHGEGHNCGSHNFGEH